jgi:diguanylate cyclase (GGDEF)-like protein
MAFLAIYIRAVPPARYVGYRTDPAIVLPQTDGSSLVRKVGHATSDWHQHNSCQIAAMKTQTEITHASAKRAPRAIAKALGQTEQAKALVDEAALDLSTVNSDIKDGLESGSPIESMEKVLVQSEAIEEKVQEAAEKLAEVHGDLKDEVRARHVLEFKLEAVKEREAAARNDAVHDSLTGLPNRVLFNDRLEHGLAQARRLGWNLAVMFIDLDGFKTINDTHGHAAGDSILKTVASRLSECVRDDDTISRHGGDEFLYLLTEVNDRQDLTTVVEKILASIQVPCYVGVNVGDQPFEVCVSASVGIAIFPKDGSTADALIQSADKAMYRAKADKSRFAFAK